MKILFIVRSTLFTVKGGDTIQVEETAGCLRKMGVEVDIKKTNEVMNYAGYNLLHFFNIIRPADILAHIKRSGKPFVVSTILVDYSYYDKQQRSGITGKLFKIISPGSIEYVKTIYRCLMRQDSLVSTSYLWKGHGGSVKEILKKATCVLVQATEEYDDLVKLYNISPSFAIVHNGVNTGILQTEIPVQKNDDVVLCVARIEGVKNQYNLIRALNNTDYKLVLIGDAPPNQKNYYRQCKKIAAENIFFISHMPQQKLAAYYSKAKVHVLPSWFEVCGLSSLEAAAMGCRVVITDNGYARSYFNGDAFYCNPSQPDSILNAVKEAMASDCDGALQQKVIQDYTWQKAAEQTLMVYKKYIN